MSLVIVILFVSLNVASLNVCSDTEGLDSNPEESPSQDTQNLQIEEVSIADAHKVVLDDGHVRFYGLNSGSDIDLTMNVTNLGTDTLARQISVLGISGRELLKKNIDIQGKQETNVAGVIGKAPKDVRYVTTKLGNNYADNYDYWYYPDDWT